MGSCLKHIRRNVRRAYLNRIGLSFFSEGDIKRIVQGLCTGLRALNHPRVFTGCELDRSAWPPL